VDGEDLPVLEQDEFALDADLVERRVLAPLAALLLDPLARREPRDDRRGPRRRSASPRSRRDRLVEPVSFGRVGANASKNSPSVRVGFENEHDLRAAGAVAFDRLEDLVVDAGGLVEDVEEVLRR
jgi:hypothetical protein